MKGLRIPEFHEKKRTKHTFEVVKVGIISLTAFVGTGLFGVAIERRRRTAAASLVRCISASLRLSISSFSLRGGAVIAMWGKQEREYLRMSIAPSQFYGKRTVHSLLAARASFTLLALKNHAQTS